MVYGYDSDYENCGRPQYARLVIIDNRQWTSTDIDFEHSRQRTHRREIVTMMISIVDLLINYVGSLIVAAGDRAVPCEIPPSPDRVAAETRETAATTAVRQVFGGYELIECAVGRYAQSVAGGAKSLQTQTASMIEM